MVTSPVVLVGDVAVEVTLSTVALSTVYLEYVLSLIP